MIKQELTIGEICRKDKIETRTWIKWINAEEPIICGQSFVSVQHNGETLFLVALSNPENGKVLVQPEECEISLKGFTKAMIAEQLKLENNANLETAFIQKCQKNGVSYIDFPTE